jgi:TonB family protein
MGKVSGALLIALVAFVFTRGIYSSPVRAHEQTQTKSPQASPPANGFADAADAVAGVLKKLKARHVAVLDFCNIGDPGWDRVGQQLAADLRVRLGTAPDSFKQTNYSNIAKAMQRGSFWQEDLIVADVAAYVVGGENVDAFVTGSLEPAGSQSAINVRLFVYKRKTGGAPTMVSTSIPFTPELKAMVSAAMPTHAQDLPEVSTNPSTQGGRYTSPRCLYCPQAEYTQSAVDAKYQGMVTLIAIIETNGKAGTISVAKGLPYGLDASAISAVRKWRFEPANGPDGNPAAVRQMIEVQFHLY